MKKLFLSGLLAGLLVFPCAAQLQLAPIFSDNMVLQRDQSIPVWGKGTPGAEITLSFGEIRKTGTVREDSSWSVTLPPKAASTVPQMLIVASEGQEIRLNNLMTGDIWLCLGQSNMQWPMEREMHFTEEWPNSRQPQLRFYNPTYAGEHVFGAPLPDSVLRQLQPETFYQGVWEVSDTSTVRAMSAVGYYFGKIIQQSVQIPIGLIDLSIGGAPIETFIRLEALRQDENFAAKTQGNWVENPALPVWVRERGRQNTDKASHAPGDENGPNHAFKPGFAFDAGIVQLIPFPVKGILWYQGESNAQEMERVQEYAALCRLMLRDYRRLWKAPKLPFFYVQLSSIDTLRYKGHLWPQFRDEQRRMMQTIPHSGMAVCSDIGDPNDVHPRNKKFVGQRLAQWALAQVYGKTVTPSGPLPRKAVFRKGEVRITFHYGEGLDTSATGPLNGFSLDGQTDAPAFLEKGRVCIPAAAKPEWAYYGWKPFSDGNLCNSAGLPASTFKIKVQ